jgi:hypothetical protein
MKLLRTLLAPLTLLALSAGSAQAQETVLTVGTAGNITATSSLGGNTTSESLSTAQIDGVLRVVAPSTFGQNFTRDKANKVFADFANYKARLTTSLIQAIQASEPSVTVNSLVINTNTLNLRLAQKTNSVAARLGTVSASVAARKHVGVPLFCTSANISFSLDNIIVSGDYNFITGDVSNAVADFAVNNTNVSCNGLLSFIGDFVLNIAGANSQLRDAIRNEANNQLAFVNMKQLFSLADFANGLNYFRNETPITAVANRAISIFKEMVNDAAINTPGIVLDFGIETGTPFGSPNRIKIVASHVPTDFGLVRRTLATINVTVPSNTQRVDLYVKQTMQQNWQYMGSTTDGFFTVPQAFVNTNTGGPDWAYIAVSRSALIGGLESFPFLIPIQPYPGGPNR